MATPDPALPIGARIEWYRKNRGMSRPVLAGQVGKSAEWLKAVERGRLQTPRLPMLLRLAQALELRDLADLTGNGDAVPVAIFAGERHHALSAVQAALTNYRVPQAGASPPKIDHLAVRLDQAWTVRHASSDHRTQLGSLLPGLITDAQRAVRTVPRDERRGARRVLAGVYRLADFYVAYQPAPELVWLVADRALTEAQEADDPYEYAASAWAMVQVLRDAARWDEAVTVAADAVRQLTPHVDRGPADWRGITGALEAEIAYVHARRGRHGDAWAHLERADAIARQLGPAYRHTQTSFSLPVLSAHATTVGVELRRPGEALRAADSINANNITSVPRRSRHLIEVARAHFQRDDRASTLSLLDKAERTAGETIRYNGFARDMLIDLRKRPPAGSLNAVVDLCARVGIVA